MDRLAMDLFVVKRAVTHFKDKDWTQVTFFDIPSGQIYTFERTEFGITEAEPLPSLVNARLEIHAPGAVVRPYHAFTNDDAERMFHFLNETTLRQARNDVPNGPGTLQGYTFRRDKPVVEQTYQDDED